jgi:hypothetical protein
MAFTVPELLADHANILCGSELLLKVWNLGSTYVAKLQNKVFDLFAPNLHVGCTLKSMGIEMPFNTFYALGVNSGI